MKLYKMELLVACRDDDDYRATAARQADNRLLTSEMLNGLADIKAKDPKLVNSIVAAANRRDYRTIISILMRKFNVFK